jgi:hypothetical protein
MALWGRAYRKGREPRDDGVKTRVRQHVEFTAKAQSAQRDAKGERGRGGEGERRGE